MKDSNAYKYTYISLPSNFVCYGHLSLCTNLESRTLTPNFHCFSSKCFTFLLWPFHSLSSTYSTETEPKSKFTSVSEISSSSSPFLYFYSGFFPVWSYVPHLTKQPFPFNLPWPLLSKPCHPNSTSLCPHCSSGVTSERCDPSAAPGLSAGTPVTLLQAPSCTAGMSRLGKQWPPCHHGYTGKLKRTMLFWRGRIFPLNTLSENCH